MKPFLRLLAVAAAVSALLSFLGTARAQLLITGNDEKVWFDENTGRTINRPPGKDTVSIIDITDQVKPKIVANLPLMNTIIGPPVNLAITPDRHLALVANSLDWVKDGEGWKGVPDNMPTNRHLMDAAPEAATAETRRMIGQMGHSPCRPQRSRAYRYSRLSVGRAMKPPLTQTHRPDRGNVINRA